MASHYHTPATMTSEAEFNAYCARQYPVCQFIWKSWPDSKRQFEINCKVHGGTFNKTAAAVLKASPCTPGVREQRLLLIKEQAIRDSEAKYGKGKIDYSAARLLTLLGKMKFKCVKHGVEYEQTIEQHMRTNGCHVCITNWKTKCFIAASRAEHGDDTFDYKDAVFKDTKTKVKLTCNGCKHEFSQAPYSHIGQGAGCPKCSKLRGAAKKKLTKEIFIERANTKHGVGTYDYSAVVYNGWEVPVMIYCHTHGFFMQSPGNHLNGKGCILCGYIRTGNALRRSQKDFILVANMVHKMKYTYENTVYKSDAEPVIITCGVPGHGDFSMTPSNHLRGQGCRKCGIKRRADACRYTEEAVIAKFMERHGETYDYSLVSYVNAITKVLIWCDYHGLFAQLPIAHWFGQGCPKCADVARAAMKCLGAEEFKKRGAEVHNGKYGYGLVDYKNNWTKVIVICPEPEHGEFDVEPDHHMRGQGCPKCKKTTEAQLLLWLQNKYKPIKIEKEITFTECKKESTKRPFRYDFRIGNTIIELDGGQHFNDIKFWGSSADDQITNDTIKAFLISSPDNGLHLNLIRIYQPWVYTNSNSWSEQLTAAIAAMENVRGRVAYIGGSIYDRHKNAYDELVALTLKVASDKPDVV